MESERPVIGYGYWNVSLNFWINSAVRAEDVPQPERGESEGLGESAEDHQVGMRFQKPLGSVVLCIFHVRLVQEDGLVRHGLEQLCNFFDRELDARWIVRRHDHEQLRAGSLPDFLRVRRERKGLLRRGGIQPHVLQAKTLTFCEERVHGKGGRNYYDNIGGFRHGHPEEQVDQLISPGANRHGFFGAAAVPGELPVQKQGFSLVNGWWIDPRVELVHALCENSPHHVLREDQIFVQVHPLELFRIVIYL